MGALLVFHILGLYPVPASTQLLVGSPLLSSYTLHNALLETSTTITVSGFDPSSIAQTPSDGVSMYVTNVSVNGTPSESICWISWKDIVGGGEIVITVDADADAAEMRGCAGSLPDSLASGGFAAP